MRAQIDQNRWYARICARRWKTEQGLRPHQMHQRSLLPDHCPFWANRQVSARIGAATCLPFAAQRNTQAGSRMHSFFPSHFQSLTRVGAPVPPGAGDKMNVSAELGYASPAFESAEAKASAGGADRQEPRLLYPLPKSKRPSESFTDAAKEQSSSSSPARVLPSQRTSLASRKLQWQQALQRQVSQSAHLIRVGHS
jgi:hypothetical protein